MPKYLGARQIAECPRCGTKVLARSLSFDGRNPRLLVCGECYDPPHPSERPYAPRNNEGRAKYPVAPENLPSAAGTLAGLLDAAPLAWEDDPVAWKDNPLAWLVGAWSGGASVGLTWARMRAVGSRVERYEIFRSVGGADFALLATNQIVYSFIGEITNTPETYTDIAISASTTVQYYVEGVTGGGQRHRTSTITINIGAL